MSADQIDKEVLAFIRERIDSVEQLEILLLLYNHPEKEWTAESVSRQLRGSAISASKRLAQFAAQGIVRQTKSSNTHYQYLPGATENDRLIGLLAEAYAVRRVTVIDLIFSKPVDKIKTFADAFKLREDK